MFYTMQIYDNFLSEEEFGLIRGYFINGNFPWYYAPFANNTNDPEHYYQLSHVIYWSNLGKVSNAFDTIKPLVNKINPEILIKIKANFNPRSDGSKVCEYHIDTDFNFNTKTAIYYINTNNGYTLFENGEKCDSVENRLVIFDSKQKHLGMSCTDQHARMLLNINYI